MYKYANNIYRLPALQYYKSKKWFKFRDRILARDNHTCQFCQSKYCLQVHHTSYKHWQECSRAEEQDCITLCSNCHTIESVRLGHIKPKTVADIEKEMASYLFDPPSPEPDLETKAKLDLKLEINQPVVCEYTDDDFISNTDWGLHYKPIE